LNYPLPSPAYPFSLFVVLEMEPSASCILGSLPTELCPQPLHVYSSKTYSFCF
jgi:hypothetical protein